jgi:ATP-dependent DNA helicase PIF1
LRYPGSRGWDDKFTRYTTSPSRMKENAPLDFNPEFKKALETMEGTSRNLLLTGRAGTGKSTLLRYFRDHTKKNAAVLAPTGVAALNVEGETIHSFFRFRTDVTPEKVKRARDRDLYAKLDAIVIDEVSMVRADLMDCIDAFLRLNGRKPGKPFGGVQVILIGDLYQLPPVVTSSDREAFRSRYPSPFFFDARSYAGLDCEFIELQKVYRQHDQGFITVLNAIRNNIITPEHMAVLNGRVRPDYEPPPEECVVCLTPFNKAADETNARRLATLPGKESVFRADTSGKAEEKSLPAPLELAVKPGAQVMMVNNDSMGRWVNGTLARVTKIVRHGGEPDEIAVELGDGPTARVEPHNWKMFRYVWNRAEKRLDTEPVGSYTQYPMRLAWAVTIHKAHKWGRCIPCILVPIW